MKNFKPQLTIENKLASLLINFLALFFIFALSFYLLYSQDVFASETNGTITSGGNNGYAWSNQAGWVNFGVANGDIHITDAGITGYAWNSNYGWINMNPSNGGVTIAANGALSGYAWGASLGWINFSGVTINSFGKFTGQASGITVGTLTFDCANCSVTTDFRPHNFRTVSALAPAPVLLANVGGGNPALFALNAGSPLESGGRLVMGPDGRVMPAHLYVFNAPMKIFPVQSGTLNQNLSNQKSVTVEAPENASSDGITIIAREEAVLEDPAPTISVIGGALFEVTAWDNSNNPARSFLKPIKITLTIPGLLRGRTDLGVYFLDPANNLWSRIQGAVFSGDSVSFSVDHLTLFAIFAGPELPQTLVSPFQLPAQFQFEIPRIEIEAPREGAEAPAGEIPTTEITSEENPPLFDIEVGPGPLKSENFKIFLVLLVLIVIASGIFIYPIRKLLYLRQKRTE